MSRNKIIPVAYSVISLASVVGGTVLTQHFAGGSAFGSTTGATTTTTGSGSSATPSVSASTGSGSGATASKDMTTTGDAVPYQFGVIQLSVTRTSGKITNIGLVQAQASAGRDAAFPTLVQMGVQSQGTNFGDLSGATYTSEAFKQALSSAISKLS